MQVKPYCIVTSEGLVFDLSNPQPGSVNIHDIANHLSKLCRFTGATYNFYSVAEHSVFCAEICEMLGFREHAFEALMHDACEAYVGDVSQPLKTLMCAQSLNEFEPSFVEEQARVDSVVRKVFKLPNIETDVVTAADRLAFWCEFQSLVSPDFCIDYPLDDCREYVASRFRKNQQKVFELADNYLLKCLDPHDAESLFLETYNKLSIKDEFLDD